MDPISNLHYTGTTEGEYKDAELGSMPAYWIHFAWDAPQTTLPILNYNIYQDGFKIPVSQTTNTNDSVWVYREDEENIANQTTTTSVEVKVVYSFGESEGVSQEFVLELGALENATLEGSAYVAGKTLFTEPDANVVVYNTAGVAVVTYNNKQQYDLGTLPAGVYLAVVKVGEKAQVVKLAL